MKYLPPLGSPGLRAVRLKLWDEDQARLVSWAECGTGGASEPTGGNGQTATLLRT